MDFRRVEKEGEIKEGNSKAGAQISDNYYSNSGKKRRTPEFE